MIQSTTLFADTKKGNLQGPVSRSCVGSQSVGDFLRTATTEIKKRARFNYKAREVNPTRFLFTENNEIQMLATLG